MKILIILLIGLILLTGCGEYKTIDKEGIYQIESLYELAEQNISVSKLTFQHTSEPRLTVTGIDKNKPYIIINCNWYINNLNWTNKGLVLEFEDGSRKPVDIVELCEEMIV